MIEKIKERVLSGEILEDILEAYDWRDFENFVREVLEAHSFKTYLHFRFKTKRKYEIDVLGKKSDLILLIDCKRLGRGRYKKSELRKAVELQEERAKEFKKFFKDKLENRKICPLIVTLFEEDILKEKNTFVLPVWKLNSFLLEIENYL